MMQNVKSNYYIIFLKFFPIIFFWWKIYSLPFIFIYKMFNLCYSVRFFLFLHDLKRLLQHIEKMCFSFIDGIYFCFFCFLFNQENLHMIHHNSNLFYDIYNTITEHNQGQTHYLSSTLNLFLRESKSSFITLSALSLIMISMLSLSQCITGSSSSSMEEVKLCTTVNCIFHLPDFLR